MPIELKYNPDEQLDYDMENEFYFQILNPLVQYDYDQKNISK